MIALMWRCRAPLAVVAMLLLGGAAPAGAQAPPANPCTSGPVTTPLVANATRLGLVDLHFFGALGAPVAYYECVAGRAQPLGQRSSTPGTLTTMWSATLWRCGRLVRHFAATATLPDGSLARGTSVVRTISCARRFDLRLPRERARGQRVRVRVVDRWHTGGVRAKLCVTSPRERRACRTLVLTGATSATSFRATTRGRWRVELAVPRARVRGSVAVGVRAAAEKKALATILATGDSTMQGIESFLGDDFGDEATVVSDVRPGFAVSMEDGWQAVAASQTARLHQSTTVVSIGANEGWPMQAADGAQHACCDEPWIVEYARRVRRTMDTYLHGGRGRVVWLTLPAPRDAKRVPIFTAVNTAVMRAAEGVAGVRILRLDLLFTPDGYRSVVRYRGHDVRVREPDGVHLNVAGAEIAARELVKVLRRLSGELPVRSR